MGVTCMVQQTNRFVRAAASLVSVVAVSCLPPALQPLHAQTSPDQVVVDRIVQGDRTKDVSLSETRQGQLLLCGGGELPTDLLSAFHHYGRGERLVVIPTASRLSDTGDFSRWIQAWSDFNWRSIDIVHAENREQAEADSIANVLQQATAVWISGGDQTRLADRYLGSRVEREIRGVMKRGGIVGGTSAGSAVATKIMITGGQSEPRIHQGLDLLPKAIVDQHFSQRQRQNRLVNAVANHPDRVGIGIDEGTGLYINAKEAKVLGQGAVHVFKSPTATVTASATTSTESPNKEMLVNFIQKKFVADTSISFDDLPFLDE